MERLIPLASMEKVLRKSGAFRVSDDAKTALKELIEKHAAEISMRAVKFANHAGRKTVKAEDIELAINEL